MICRQPRANRALHRPSWSSLQLILGLAALCASAACGAASTPDPAGPEPLVLRIGHALPAFTRAAGIRQFVNSLTGERLIGLTVEGRFEARLAEHWRRSDDGRTWTFTLRPGLRFHDGTPLDAAAAAGILEADIRASTAPGLIDVESVAALDDVTIEIALGRPSALFLEDLSGNSLRRPGDDGGSGPFVLDSSSDDRFVLRAYDGYFIGAPAIDRVELTAYPSVRSAWTAMMRGEIDALYEVGRDALDFVEAEPSVALYTFPRPFVVALGFNLRQAVLRQPAVRRAIDLAIDRERIVREWMRGRGLVADGFTWPHHWAVDPTVPASGFDPVRAAGMLDEAGLVVKETAHGPARFRLSCLLPAELAEYEGLGMIVQKNLHDIGIDLVLVPSPARDVGRRLGAGDFETFLFEMANNRTLAWPYRFLHSPQPNLPVLVDWGYTAADEALDRIRDALSDDEVRAGVSALQRVLREDPPAAFIAWDERARAVSRRFDVPAPPGHDVFTSTLLAGWTRPGTRPD